MMAWIKTSWAATLGGPFAWKGGAFPGTGGTCNTGTLAAGGNCTLVVTFAPTAVTTYSSSVGVQYTDSTATPFTNSRAIQGTGE